jgi:hypothetical protein
MDKKALITLRFNQIIKKDVYSLPFMVKIAENFDETVQGCLIELFHINKFYHQ